MIACSTTETVEVIKEVPVEKVVEKVVEKEVEVIKEVEVNKEVAPAPTYAKSINVRDVFFFTEGFTPPRGGSFFEHRISQQIYEGLTALNTPMVTRGDSAVPVPNLAESWDISADGTTYTFKIREGVNFTTGNPLYGQAVVDSLKRSIHVIELDKEWRRLIEKGNKLRAKKNTISKTMKNYIKSKKGNFIIVVDNYTLRETAINLILKG